MAADGARARRSGGRRLGRDFYRQETASVARALLGAFLVHRTEEATLVGRIVETEAYLGAADPASHAFRGPTARNATMFGPPGRLYVYFIYGVHYCCNVVTAPKGVGEAVLLRALEPIAGLDVMRVRRGTDVERNLCSGPGKLVEALAIGPRDDGADLVRGPLGIWERGSWTPPEGAAWDEAIASSARVGITKAAELPLRFFLRGNRHVSRG